MSGEERRDLPPKLRDFLTVAQPESSSRITKPQPSAVLSRVKAFLPQMEEANKNVTSGESVVSITRDDTQPSTEGQHVQMDLYVDKTMGELVTDDKPRKLVEELPNPQTDK